MDKIGRTQVLVTLDLTKGYWEIPLALADKQKITFDASIRLYQFTKIPFGLNGATTSFQRLMDKDLRGLQDCAVTYVNDILILSPSRETHLVHLKQVLDALRQT